MENFEKTKSKKYKLLCYLMYSGRFDEMKASDVKEIAEIVEKIYNEPDNNNSNNNNGDITKNWIKVRLCFNTQFCGSTQKVVEVNRGITNVSIQELFEKELGVPYDKNCWFEILG